VGTPIRRAPWIGGDDYKGAGQAEQVVIGDDVWLGYGAIVLTGVTIGRGAVVAAGSIVLDDVEPYVIVGGNPARKLGVRFSPTEIVEHETKLYGRVLTR
jgi:acetyltransferase-like isoleucine patch superfamily enzyme